MRKILVAVLAVGMAFLTACGSGKNTAASSSAASYAYGNEAMAVTTAAGALVAGDSAMDLSGGEKGYADLSVGEGSQSSSSITPVSQKKIIKNGNLEMEADDVLEAYQRLVDFVTSKGGYEFSQNVRNSADYVYLNAVFKIPPEALEETIAFAGECGKVVNVSTSSDDVTAAYTDTEIRLKNKRRDLEKYYELYEKATTMEEIIAIQNQINYITADIESYEGQIKLWDSMINESTLNVYIQEAADPNKIPEDVDWSSLSLSSMGKIIRNGFTSVVNGIVTFFQWLIIIIVSISPLLIIAAVIIAVILARRIKKKKAQPSASDVPAKDSGEQKK